jgi:hypothetical protein
MSVNEILLYGGSLVIFVWGVGHIVPTRPVVRGFGDISRDNTRIITMEWIAEGLTLCFLGLLVAGITLLGEQGSPASTHAYRMSALMLIVLAGLSAFTGARTSILPMKLCPYVKSAVGVSFLLGSAL